MALSVQCKDGTSDLAYDGKTLSLANIGIPDPVRKKTCEDHGGIKPSTPRILTSTPIEKKIVTTLPDNEVDQISFDRTIKILTLVGIGIIAYKLVNKK